MKKKILGASDTWSAGHLSQGTSILCCRLSDFKSNNKLLLKLHVDITQSSSNSLTQPASFLFALTYCLITQMSHV